MKILIVAISITIAVFIEWTLASFDLQWFPPPLILSVTFFWFIRLRLSKRILTALPVAVLLDGVSLYPPGTYLISLLILVLFSEFLKKILSEADSTIIRTAGIAILLLIYPFLRELIAWFIQQFIGSVALPSASLDSFLIVTAMIWTILISIFFAVSDKILAKNNVY